MDIIIWVILLIVFIIVEMATVNLVTIWFAAGSFVALICAACNLSPAIQCIVFFVVSTVLVILTRPFCKKISAKKMKTNFDRIIGMCGIVTEAIDNLNGKGYVSVDGKEWMARTEDGDSILPGEQVRILRIDGAKIYVQRLKT